MHDYYSADIHQRIRTEKFNEKPNLDFDLVEERILEIIRENKAGVDYYDDLHIRFGDVIIPTWSSSTHALYG